LIFDQNRIIIICIFFYFFVINQFSLFWAQITEYSFSCVVSVRAWVAVKNELMSPQRQNNLRPSEVLYFIAVLVSYTGDTFHLTMLTCEK